MVSNDPRIGPRVRAAWADTQVMRKVRLPSGNLAIYRVEQRHRASAELVRMYGVQQAVCLGGQWYWSGARERITDQQTLDMIEHIEGVAS